MGVVIYMNFGCVLFVLVVFDVIKLIVVGYINIEFNFEVGKCGLWYDYMWDFFCELMGVEDVIIVNNCVVVVMLCFVMFVKDKEVIVLWGELIEIGGLFRVFDIIV